MSHSITNDEDKYELICNSADEEHQDKKDSVLVSYEKSKLSQENIFGPRDLKNLIIFKILFGIVAMFFIYFIFNTLFNKALSNFSKIPRVMRR